MLYDFFVLYTGHLKSLHPRRLAVTAAVAAVVSMEAVAAVEAVMAVPPGPVLGRSTTNWRRIEEPT